MSLELPASLVQCVNNITVLRIETEVIPPKAWSRGAGKLTTSFRRRPDQWRKIYRAAIRRTDERPTCGNSNTFPIVAVAGECRRERLVSRVEDPSTVTWRKCLARI